MPCFVYILQSQLNQSFYKGHTDDLVRRIAEHNSGKVTYSKKFRPWNLVWLTTKPNKKEAYGLELKLKNTEHQPTVGSVCLQKSLYFCHTLHLLIFVGNFHL